MTVSRSIFLSLLFLTLPASASEAPGSKFLRLYVDQPGRGGDGNKAEGNLVRQDFGHIFVELADPQTGATTGRKGFYPKNGVMVLFQQKDAGEIRADYRRHYEVWKEFPITDEQYAAALEFVRTSETNPPSFDLSEYNCADWAIDVVRAAGQAVPDPQGEQLIGTGEKEHFKTIPLWRGSYPGGIGQELLKDGGKRNWRGR